MRYTLEDANAAGDKLRFGGVLPADNHELTVIRTFLNEVEMMAVATASDHTERDFFIIEAAYQNGFEAIDDNAELLVVSAEKLMQYVSLYRIDADHLRQVLAVTAHELRQSSAAVTFWQRVAIGASIWLLIVSAIDIAYWAFK